MPPLQALDPRLPVHAQITSQSFSLQNTPISQDTSAHTHALALEAALGGPDLMASRVGTCAHPSLVAAQLLRVREAWPDVWSRTGRVQMASSFLASLLTGTLVGMGEAEASSTGLWVHAGSQPGGQSGWDEGVMEIVGGNRDEGHRIWQWLGEVDVSGGRRRIGTISRYLVDRFGFDSGLYFRPVCRAALMGLFRDHRRSLHIRLPIFVPIVMPFSFGCRAHIRSYGHHDGSRAQLHPHPPLQPLSAPRAGRQRKETLYCDALQQVRRPFNKRSRLEAITEMT